MSLFKRNPADALAKVRAALAHDAARIAELQGERQRKLIEADADDIREIEAVDRQLADMRRRVEIHRARELALETECRAEAHEKLEQRRLAAVKVIERKLRAREAVAAELEASIKRTGDLFFQLLNSPSVAVDWPFGPVPGAIVDADAVCRETAWALFSAGRPSGGRTVFPGPSNIGLGVSGVHAQGIEAVVAGQADALLSLLHSLPIDDGAIEADAPPETVPPHGLAALATT